MFINNYTPSRLSLYFYCVYFIQCIQCNTFSFHCYVFRILEQLKVSQKFCPAFYKMVKELQDLLGKLNITSTIIVSKLFLL